MRNPFDAIRKKSTEINLALPKAFMFVNINLTFSRAVTYHDNFHQEVPIFIIDAYFLGYLYNVFASIYSGHDHQNILFGRNTLAKAFFPLNRLDWSPNNKLLWAHESENEVELALYNKGMADADEDIEKAYKEKVSLSLAEHIINKSLKLGYINKTEAIKYKSELEQNIEIPFLLSEFNHLKWARFHWDD